MGNELMVNILLASDYSPIAPWLPGDFESPSPLHKRKIDIRQKEGSMKIEPNPGGNIPQEAIVGRNSLFNSAWKTLESQSLIVSERRIGKTSLMRKMGAEAPNGWVQVPWEKERPGGWSPENIYLCARLVVTQSW